MTGEPEDPADGGLVPGLVLSDGQQFRATVLALDAGGEVRLGMLGHEVRVRSQLPLERGQELMLVACRGAECLRLRVVQNAGEEGPASDDGRGLLDILA